MRTSFYVGLGLMLAFTGSAQPQGKSSEIPKAIAILHQAARAAGTIPDDPPRPQEAMGRTAYYDPLYGPEKREKALGAIAQAEAKAGDFAGSLEIIKAASQGDVRDAMVRAVVIVRATKGTTEPVIEATARLPEDRRQDIFLESGLARVREGNRAGALQFAHLIADEAAKGRLLAEIADAQGRVGDVRGATQTAEAIGAMKTSTAQMKVLALVAVAMAQEKSGDRAASRNSFRQALTLVGGDPSLRGTLGNIAQARAALGQFNEAVETAGMIPFDVPRNVVLARIAGSQAKLGYVKEALQTVQAIRGEDSEFWKATALARVGRVQASRGDPAAAKATFQNAIRSAESIKDSDSTAHAPGGTSTAVQSMAYFRGWRLSGIAKAEAQSDEKMASAATFEKALAVARGMPDPPEGSVSYEAYSKDMLFYLIAKDQAEAGLVKSALQTAGEIRLLPGKSRERGWSGGDPRVTALHDIARAQALRNEPSEVVAWAEALPVPSEKALALLGLADGLLERAGVEFVEPLPDDI